MLALLSSLVSCKPDEEGTRYVTDSAGRRLVSRTMVMHEGDTIFLEYKYDAAGRISEMSGRVSYQEGLFFENFIYEPDRIIKIERDYRYDVFDTIVITLEAQGRAVSVEGGRLSGSSYCDFFGFYPDGGLAYMFVEGLGDTIFLHWQDGEIARATGVSSYTGSVSWTAGPSLPGRVNLSNVDMSSFIVGSYFTDELYYLGEILDFGKIWYFGKTSTKFAKTTGRGHELDYVFDEDGNCVSAGFVGDYGYEGIQFEWLREN